MKKQDWILPEGAPWFCKASYKAGVAHQDIPIEFARLHENPRYIKICISDQVQRDLGLTQSNMTVALSHLMRIDDTRVIRFHLKTKKITELIEDLREKIYDGERNCSRVSLATFLGWRETLKVLKLIKHRADNKDNHE